MKEKKTSLTDVQFAYMAGRNTNLYLGGISTHFYAEFESTLQPERLERAIQKVLVRQEMLRGYIAEDGTLRILNEVPQYKLPVEDLRKKSEEEANGIMQAYRDKTASRIFPLGKWPMFEFHLFKISDDIGRLVADFDMMIVDGMSTELIIQEILYYYDHEEEEPEQLPCSFTDYLKYKTEQRQKKGKEDAEFWKEKIENFHAGPFCEKIDENASDIPEFSYLEHIIDAQDWLSKEKELTSQRVLPVMYLLTAYAKTVSAWTNTPKLTINMTVSDRKGTADMNLSKVIGDFTKVLPVDFDFTQETDLIKLSQITQKKIASYKRHLDFNIFSFAKEVCVKDDAEDKTAFPFVFTGMLFDLAKEGWNDFGNRGFQVSQTPQVLLDNQITLKSGALTIHWDFPRQYWKKERLMKMQKYFIDLVLKGKSDELKEHTTAFVSKYNATEEPFEYVSALSLFEKQVIENPDNTAILTDTAEVTYEELDEMANREANYLIEKYGEKKGYIIEGNRSYETIVHILAALKTGGYYVPIAEKLPEKRKQFILQKSNCVTILKEQFYWENECDEYSDERIPRDEDDGEELMYVIYTSGTTGNPKGVAVSKRALINTVYHINKKFDITEKDQFIGISAFGFDLSVYDVFGALTAGAALFIHNKQENIYGMIDEINEFPITVWNTVPALMQILVNELDENYINEKLRLVLLSGDWIPVDLPQKIQKKFPNAKIISLGGATEAAIWSIYYPIEKVEKNWSSIPYGYPLENQTMYILGEDLAVLPEEIEGDIYIGGAGVAIGYQNDPEKTKESFIEHPEYGRLYKTGDRGYYSYAGYMVFCGRKDTQVKIHGNRIELGEIESCLKRQKNVAAATAQVITANGNVKKLFGYYVPTDSMDYDAEWIKKTSKNQMETMKKAQEALPDYLTLNEYIDISNSLETVSTAIINNAFYRFGFFTEKEGIYSLEELFVKGQIIEKYNKLVYQWADVLANIGKIKKISSGVYQVIEPLKEIDVDAMYEKIMQKKGVSYWGGSFEFLMLCNKNVLDILKADVNPLTILFPEGQVDRAENIYRSNPIAEYMNNMVAQAIEEYVKKWEKKRPVRILEFGAGTGGTTSAVLEKLRNYNVEYTFTDLSTFFTEKAKEQFAEYDFVNYELFNIDKMPQSQGYAPETFDIIFGANVLHDAKYIKKTLKNFRYLLSKEGMLLALEVTTNKIYHKVSIGFIEGFSGYSDERLEKNEPLLNAEEWKKVMLDSGYIEAQSYPEQNNPAEAFEQHVIFSYAASKKEYKEEKELMETLKEELPSYMIPERIYALYELPLSANAKVNLKELPYELGDVAQVNREIIAPANETEQLLYEIIKDTLGVDELSTDVNIFTIGADSLKSISVLTKLKNHNIEVSLSNMYKYSTIQQMAAYIDSERKRGGVTQSVDEELNFKPDLAHRYDPFPLSDLQESYYIGAHETEGFNSIPTAGYVEIECDDYDHDKLFGVIKRLMERHDMLRAYIDKNGVQHVLKELPDFEIPITDLRNKKESEVKEYLEHLRRDMVQTRLDLSKAPLFLCKISQLTDNFVILHIYADGQIMDGWSFQLFFTELGTLYKDPNKEMVPLKTTFRDYIMYREALKKTKKYQIDKEYWLNRIPTLPEAGLLPLENDIDKLDTVEGIQVECGIPIEEWELIEKKAKEHGVSAFSVLMTSFAVSVARWNDKKRFLLNIPEFYRPPFDEDIFKILGECASFLLFVMEDEPEDTFHEKVVKTQQQIMELKDHNSFGGMEITREIYRKNNGYSEVLAPLVFGMLPDAQEFQDTFIAVQKDGLRIRYQENHTSQIWIDVNTCVYSDRIEFNYNSLKGLIKREVLENLAVMQKAILHKAATDESFWREKVEIALPEGHKKLIDASNATTEVLKTPSLAEMIESSFAQFGDRPYVKMKDRSFTYSEIQSKVFAVANTLLKKGVKKGDKVAVYIGKSLEQIVSTLAIAYIGAVYVPIEYDYSYDLVISALKWIHCKNILVLEKDAKELVDFIEEVTIIDEELLSREVKYVEAAKIKGKELAAIIHTSGTTGRPKAVMVKQESLSNALIYTNHRFNVTQEDTAIGVTNAAHDMSLYDIFGMIAAGASMVLPDEQYAKDPEEWLKLMKKYPVTIWNSVPAMQEMLVEAVTEENRKQMENLRIIVMGGDYIKPSLLRRIRKWNKKADLISAGGPTETTLWNILHKIEEKDIEDEIIPYGKPIANNRYYILNENMKQVPVGVTGTLYGAGVGVSIGYCEDKEMTDKKFIVWEQTGERLYNTGDRGHYREDGTIIFDGREDQQVKINGKRIELSSIASVAEKIDGVHQAAAIVTPEHQLVLFYTGSNCDSEQEIRKRIAMELPEYMLPKKCIPIDEIPVTLNAKVNKQELLRIYESYIKNKKKAVVEEKEGGDRLEELLREKFCELLNISPEEVDVDSDFFAMGGNSLIAMKLLSQLRETFEAEISLTDLFMTSTIREMKELLEERDAKILV